MKFRIFILLVFFAFTTKAQHAYYSSLNQNLLSVNPAFAGTNKQLRTQVIYGETGMPKYSGKNTYSYYAGVDCLGKKYSGFGLSFNRSQYGNVLRKTQADFSYALHFTIRNKIKIVHAYQFSFFEYRYDPTKLNFGEYNINPNDAFVWGPDLITVRYKRNLDFSTGLLAYGKRFYAGMSLLSITQPDEGVNGVSKRPLTQIYQGKYKFLNPDQFNIDVYGLTKVQKTFWINKAGFNSKNTGENFLQYGTYLNYRSLSIHLAHQLNEISDYDAFIAGVALNANGFKMGCNTKCNYATHLSSYYFYELYLQYAFGRAKKEADENQGIKLID